MDPIRSFLPALSALLLGGLCGPATAAEDRPLPEANLAPRPATLEEALAVRRFKATGWFNASFGTTPGTEADTRRARVFDDDSEGFRVQQMYGSLERTLPDGSGAAWGGKVALLIGTDARLVHAHGLLDQQVTEGQVDLLEAHALVRVPVARGLTFKIGKCTTPMGAEVIEAANNLLPSRSFLFGYAIPFTHTGAIATLQASERVSLAYGLVLGWDVFDDANDALTHLATFAWKSPSERDALTVNAIVGAERPDDDTALRTVLDATWTHVWSDGWKTMLNADIGTEQGAAAFGEDAAWWGVAGYVTHTASEWLSATLRAEWFRDRDGTRLGQASSLTGLTLGLDWKPWSSLPGLHLRPEVRWDHSLDGPFFDGGQDEDQLSLTLDLLFTL